MGGHLIVIIFAGLFILLLLIIGQMFYNKFPKLCYTIWGFTVLLLVYFIYSFNTANTRLGDQAIHHFVGTYTIDIHQSQYDSVDLLSYDDLILTVHENKTFTFSKQTPFFTDTMGYWQPMDDGDISWTEMSVGDENLMQAQIDPDKWVFSGRDLKNWNSNNSIVFIRK